MHPCSVLGSIPDENVVSTLRSGNPAFYLPIPQICSKNGIRRDF